MRRKQRSSLNWTSITLAVLWFGSQARAEVYCREDSFSLVAEIIPLDVGQFTESSLREVFVRYGTAPADKRELYVLALPRSVFVDGQPPSEEQRPDETYPVSTTGPAALFLQFSGNSFFQYRDVDGNIQWVQMEGRNPFELEVGGAAFELVGLNFPRRGRECTNLRKKIVLVGHRVRLEGLLEFLRSLDAFGHRVGNMDIKIYSSFEHATARIGTRFTTPRAMTFYSDERARARGLASRAPGYSFYWIRGRTRAELIHYREDGEFDWSMQLRMEEESFLDEVRRLAPDSP